MTIARWEWLGTTAVVALLGSGIAVGAAMAEPQDAPTSRLTCHHAYGDKFYSDVFDCPSVISGVAGTVTAYPPDARR
ncbi:hypothetical protein [Nocardia sp. NPDC052566]|uniref:hypothetical protein n=1 Tax=Nocardia sp. NPDC052566 TaxID=3364330 RepID=UPI0037CC643A